MTSSNPNDPFFKSKVFWIGMAAVALIGVIYGVHSTHAPGDGARIGTLTRGDLVQRVTIAGSVSPNRKTNFAAPYAGYIRKIFVSVGQMVKEGDPIVSLTQTLHASGEDVYPMRAPFGGTVVQVLRTEGEYVDPANSQQPNSLIVRIDDLTHTYVDASTPEIDVEKLRDDQEVEIKSSAVLDRVYHGKIKSISLAAIEQNQWDKGRVEFPVKIEVTDNDGRLKSGMSVVTDIITNRKKSVVMVRHEFVHEDGAKHYLITENGAKKYIELGLQNEDGCEVVSGATEGERVRQVDFLAELKEN